MSEHSPRIRSRRHTMAYRNFSENIWKTMQLLEFGLSGISGETEKYDRLLEKFNGFVGKRGRSPKAYEPEIERLPDDENGLMGLRLDIRTASTVKKTVEQTRSKHAALRFHLYAILAVTIWGAFETYLVMLYEELYRTRPELLKSDENLSFRDALDHQEAILGFLIERQIDKVGHFTLTENLKYLKTRLNFEFTMSAQKKLSDYYLVRNIVAHNLGLVQGAVRDKIPHTITIKGNQIQISKAYLVSMIKSIQKSTTSLETFIMKKYF